ncbi:MAG: tetratricopeptide repeat protein [Chloroflexi bacterium]|nr:MAG: tetratricopeptide repeat protein [Chloroflexota bacterium]
MPYGAQWSVRCRRARVPSGLRRASTAANNFGARLRVLRRAKGLRQQDLAGGEYSAAYISMLESGRTRASMKALEHISRKLGIGVAELLGGVPQPNQAEARLEVARTLLAAEESERALQVLAEVRDKELTPRQHVARLRLEGRAHLQLRNAKAAMPVLQRALLLAQQLNDNVEVAHVRNQIGLCCYYNAAHREAVQHHLACLEAIHRGEVRDAVLEFRVLSNLGNEHGALGELPAAIGYYERALAMANDVVDHERLAGIHAGLAFAYTKQEDYEGAITHARTSFELYEQIGAKKTLPEIMNNLAYLYGKVGNRTRADALLVQAIDGARTNRNLYALPHLILSRAELHKTTDPEQARRFGREALAAAEAAEQREAILSVRLFLAGLETDPTTARVAFDQCLSLARLSVPERERRVLEAHADWEQAHGDVRRAAKLLKEALHK